MGVVTMRQRSMHNRLSQMLHAPTRPTASNPSSSTDDALLAYLQAPPDLHDGVESLAYWQRRRQRLPWYRLAARREAARMVMVWERRVRAAVLRQRGVPMAPRLLGALVVARTQLRRWLRRAGFALAATAALLLVIAPAAVALDLLLRAL